VAAQPRWRAVLALLRARVTRRLASGRLVLGGMAMSIDYSVEDKIATIVINRPEALNAMTPEMYAELSKAWVDVRDNPDVYVAVVTGAPQPERTPQRQVFTAGADLKLTIPAKNPLRDLWQTQQDQILNRGLEVWKPVVAAVNGL